MAENKEAAPTSESKEEEPRALHKRILRVDQFYSKQDRQWHYKRTTKPQLHAERFSKYTLVIRRLLSVKGIVRDTEVDIKSAKLANVLLDILQNVEGLQLRKSPPLISPRMLFHCSDKLLTRLKEELVCDQPDKQLIEDITTALEFIKEEFDSAVENLKSLLNHGEISYDLLWALFKPNAIIYTEDNLLREPQAEKFISGDYEETPEGKWFKISTNIIHSDGDRFGWAEAEIKIPSFEGCRKITSLNAYPLTYHPKCNGVCHDLTERGRVFVQLATEPTCQEYIGDAIYLERYMDKTEMMVFAASGRIMTDPTAFRSNNPDAWKLMLPWIDKPLKGRVSGEDLMFCNYRILGFSFSKKRWGAFAVSKMSDVVWDEEAFDKLILEEKRRKIISQLVMSHRYNDSLSPDIINGKGGGLVGLLSGSPGVGKTLTAEVVAELSKRPLYMVSAGELGTRVSEVDKKLQVVLDIIRRWGCVLLIDEADVFLYKRETGQLEHNALVSVFLRRLEYLQGIVILTTNRVKDIDEAFKSRIHFKFHYPALNADDRAKIWNIHLERAMQGRKGLPLSDTDLKGLASLPMNGREIKNCVACAISIVRAGRAPFTIALLRDIVDSLIDDDTADEDSSLL
ncbi:P-loop containing nucleoside triphosphate hydrolase protein [Xylaria sp. CBS 124048]|nr:P-loop containing nucleoside triphosphate hydrolase protein [Xylaria sp. CBS 124048]